jgi:cysteine synthase A
VELLDEVIRVSSKQAVDTARELAVKEGLLVGISSGKRLLSSAGDVAQSQRESCLVKGVVIVCCWLRWEGFV